MLNSKSTLYGLGQSLFQLKYLKFLGGLYFSSHFLIACTTTPTEKKPLNSPQVLIQTPSPAHLHRSKHLSYGLQKTFSVPAKTADRLSPLIIQSADQHGISPLLLAAVIKQESSYRSHVVSSAGAVGLTQVMPQYWRNKCSGNLYNESINIKCGTLILSSYNKMAGDWSKALAYYNVGPYGYRSNIRMRQQGMKYAKSVQQHHQSLINTLNINSLQSPQVSPVKFVPAPAIR
ncbi:transglycosylase-like protein with SLT domain [Acinetobacter calcoaceticus]|uniref:Transglycosylase-like protein with SLT domain n=1 Tax=Acinetobacter calcoaceticus TaxID=471 RepID=A0A4R1XBF7_ACICA|nr:transglycosylase-like protein with SLT domain [Acinetobacter calcoaceticus]